MPYEKVIAPVFQKAIARPLETAITEAKRKRILIARIQFAIDCRII